jgi:hypothetical protein
MNRKHNRRATKAPNAPRQAIPPADSRKDGLKAQMKALRAKAMKEEVATYGGRADGGMGAAITVDMVDVNGNLSRFGAVVGWDLCHPVKRELSDAEKETRIARQRELLSMANKDGRSLFAPPPLTEEQKDVAAKVAALVEKVQTHGTAIGASVDKVESVETTAGDGSKTVTLHVSDKPSRCDHVFKGWRAFDDGRGGEAVCEKCGVGAFEATDVWG